MKAACSRESLPGYEERAAQIEMARMVAEALKTGEHSARSGDRTGKSLAYLLPIVRSGKVALISTANKALQEQLFYKDIPFVQQHVQPFKAALVKGMGNYLCLDRLRGGTRPSRTSSSIPPSPRWSELDRRQDAGTATSIC